MQRLPQVLCALFTLNVLYPRFAVCSDINVPREIQDLIEREKQKGRPLKMLQCSTPLGGKRPEVIQSSFYPQGSTTGPIQHAGVSPEEKEFNATTGRFEVVGRNLYTIFFDPIPNNTLVKASSPSATTSISADRRDFHWQRVCRQLGLPPSKTPAHFNDSDDDDNLDLSD